MELVPIIVSLIAGSAIGFFIGRNLLAKINQQQEADLNLKKEAVNKQADAIIEDARRAATRKLEEAEMKANNMIFFTPFFIIDIS